MGKQKYTKEQMDRAIEMKRSGSSTPEITSETGMPLPSLKKLFRKNNVKLTDEQRKQVCSESRWAGHEPVTKEGLKRCSKCDTYKPLDFFYDDSTRLSGKTVHCKQCYADYYEKNVEHVKQRVTAYKKEHVEEVKAADHARYEKNAEQVKKTSAVWARTHPKERLEIGRRYHATHPGARAKRSALRRAREHQATPKNPTPEYYKQMAEIYANCPPGHHVDHIVPLKGENVCGLHIPTNLQYLPAVENLKKHNKF
jgi:hypothetical protein